MRIKKQIKVFIGPHEIAGYYSNLSKGLQSIGVRADFITFQSHPFGYGGETKLPLILKAMRWVNKFRGKQGRSRPVRFLYALPGEILSAVWALVTILSYDVFIFGFGRTLLRNNYDLKLLKLFRKRVICNLGHGSDARPPFIDGGYQSKQGKRPTIEETYRLTILTRKIVDRHFKYASVVLGAPYSTSQYAPSKFINHFSIGIPFDRDDLKKIENQKDPIAIRERHSVRVLHAPSHAAAKGSPLISSAIKRLKDKGYAIDFILIEGRPVAEVFEEIIKCDLVVDQIYSDTPMAGFATEAAFHGKPVIVGGYGFDKLRSFVPVEMWPPSITSNPNQFEQAIEEMVSNVNQCERLGKAAQVFVREKWSPTEVGKRYMRLINDDIPESWWVEPKEIAYLHGAGQSEETSREIIREMVSTYGEDSLQLSHRPDLHAAFLKFAGMGDRNRQENA